MYRLHLTRNLRSLAFLLIVSAVLAACGLLWWANENGLPSSWRATIEREMSKRGAHVTIGGLRYIPLQGVVATQVRVYSEPTHQHEISRLERIILDFDKTKLARGFFHLNKIQLSHARLDLPVDPHDPNSETLNITDANGTIFMPGDRRLEVRDARGKIAGIDVVLDARIIGYQQEGTQKPEDSNTGKRRQLLAQILRELGTWQFDQKSPPAIQISIDGDVNDHATITAKLALQVKDLEKNGHILKEIKGEADLVGDLLTITSLRANDLYGAFEGHIDFNIRDREGRFDISSSLEVPKLLAAWLGIPPLQQVSINGKQILEAEGDFALDEKGKPKIRMTGHVRCNSVVLRGVPFDAVKTAFSWRDDTLFLRDLEILRPDGKAKGKAMIEWPLVRLEIHTTLPVPVYRPFFVGQPLERVLDDMTEREGAAIDVTLKGGFNANNRYAWAYTGSGSAKNLNYRDVPVNSAFSKFTLNHQELDFHDATVVFNYTKYPLRKAFDGPNEGTAKVGRIRFDAPEKIVEVEDVSGLIWAAPLVRFFAPKIADSLEQYRFHHSPELKGSGVVDTTPKGRTALNISFRSDRPADYMFLGSNITFGKPSGQVSIRGERVTVSNLKLDAFDGPVSGNIDYLGSGKLAGDISWTKLSIPGLSSTYGFQIKSGGTVTGRLAFSLTNGNVATMDGDGLLALEKAELFSVPMFGPLTPLIGGVLNDNKAGFQQATAAFCTFKILDGVLSSNDFRTSTTSLNFAGNGTLDLRDRTLDMTMRMNATGLLGILSRPLRPFSGLFQFHGTGPLKETKWESMRYTDPPESQNDLLMEPPKARIVPNRE